MWAMSVQRKGTLIRKAGNLGSWWTHIQRWIYWLLSGEQPHLTLVTDSPPPLMDWYRNTTTWPSVLRWNNSLMIFKHRSPVKSACLLGSTWTLAFCLNPSALSHFPRQLPTFSGEHSLSKSLAQELPSPQLSLCFSGPQPKLPGVHP